MAGHLDLSVTIKSDDEIKAVKLTGDGAQQLWPTAETGEQIATSAKNAILRMFRELAMSTVAQDAVNAWMNENISEAD